MTIDDTREVPIVPPGGDLAGYVRQYEAGGFPVSDVVEVICGACGGRTFRFAVDERLGGALRTCSRCGDEQYVADTADRWIDAEPVDCLCGCGDEEFAAAIGYARNTAGGARWVTVGLRCQNDGAVGVYADWAVPGRAAT